jgi:hypothetical protein
MCNGCHAFEPFGNWFSGRCQKTVHNLMPHFSLGEKFNCLEAYYEASRNTRNYRDFPKNIGVAFPGSNVNRDTGKLDDSMLTNLGDVYCYFSGMFDAVRKTYGHRGTRDSEGYNLCIVDGNCAYFTDTSEILDVVVKVQDEVYRVLGATVRDGIVIGMLDRDTGVSALQDYDIQNKDQSIFFAAPGGFLASSKEKFDFCPSIEFRNGYAVALHVAESTFVNCQGNHYQLYASIARRELTLNADRTSYTIKLAFEVGPMRRYKITFERDFSNSVYPSNFYRRMLGRYCAEGDLQTAAFGDLIHVLSVGDQGLEITVDCAHSLFLRSITLWKTFFRANRLMPWISRVIVTPINTETPVRKVGTRKKRKSAANKRQKTTE